MNVFLSKTRRMHPGPGRFISDAFYDGRLLPETGNERQGLILNPDADPALEATGIRFVGIEHEGCSQKSEPEASDFRQSPRLLAARQWPIAGSGQLPHRASQVRARCERVDLCDRIDDAQGREEGHAGTGLRGSGRLSSRSANRRALRHNKPAAMEPSHAKSRSARKASEDCNKAKDRL
jgi:hypothetical protein